MSKISQTLALFILVVVAGCEQRGPEEPSEPRGETAEDAVNLPGEIPGVTSGETIGAMPRQGVTRAEARIEPTEGNRANGLVRFRYNNGTLTIAGTIEGLTPGEHGLHVHEYGDCSAPDASTAGGHFDPDGDPHGSPRDDEDSHHVGDLGNITADADGVARVDIDDDEMTLSGEKSVLGRALIVHADPDDFVTQPDGDAGERVGCGVIEEAAGAAGADDAMPGGEEPPARMRVKLR